MLPQPATALAALLVWGGVLCDALLVSVGGGAPSASIERTRASSATMHVARPARRTSTISAQLQSAPPPEGFEWGYDSSAAAADAGGADAASSPEELLLKAIEALREQDLARARELLAQARAACEQAGGPTDEQASLLELVAGRVSTAAAPRPPPRPPPAAASARPIGGAPTTGWDANLMSRLYFPTPRLYLSSIGAPTTGWDANLASDASVDDLNFPGSVRLGLGLGLG